MRHNEKAKIGGNDETLSNFIKESTREGERKRNKEQGPKFWQAKEPQRDEPHGGKGKLNAKTTTSHMKHIKGEVGPIKLQALEESSFAITARL